MSASSDIAELSTIRAQLDDLARRVLAIADRYGNTPDSLVASDLYAADRAIRTALRSLERAADHLTA
jgi:hypothetical protein